MAYLSVKGGRPTRLNAPLVREDRNGTVTLTPYSAKRPRAVVHETVIDRNDGQTESF